MNNQAKQEKKLRWKEERRAREEEERQRLDAEEAALEAAEKQETLAQTQALILEQTDAMKSLRSAQCYTAILKVCHHGSGTALGLMDVKCSVSHHVHADAHYRPWSSRRRSARGGARPPRRRKRSVDFVPC